MILAAAVACLDRVLEGPLVLATGLGDARSLSPDGTGGMYVATGEGLVRVGGEGEIARIADGAKVAVTTHPGRLYLLEAGRVRWEGGEADAAGVVDVLAGWDGELLLLGPHALEVLDPATGARATRWKVDGRARAVALGPPGQVLVVTDDALWSVGPVGADRLAEGLGDPRGAATDTRGRVWVVDGEVLYRVDAGPRVEVARWLGDVRDVHVGTGGLLLAENLYLVTGDGTLSYLQPP
ncbi:MAG: hypothetical protein ACOZNI_35410 [Myxococcota bacterium]